MSRRAGLRLRRSHPRLELLLVVLIAVSGAVLPFYDLLWGGLGEQAAVAPWSGQDAGSEVVGHTYVPVRLFSRVDLGRLRSIPHGSSMCGLLGGDPDTQQLND